MTLCLGIDIGTNGARMIAVWMLTGTGRLAFGGATISSRVIWALSEAGVFPMAVRL